MAMLGGEAMPRILMQVIRFCINSDDKQLKKLCMLYWEVVPKYQEPTSEAMLAAASGGPPVQRKMLPEMLLVCNALMNDLNHPNEFVRGSMLRFMCKVKDEEILGPLIPSIKACLEHRHPYVRKNAALAIFHAHKLHGETLIPDGPELIAAFLEQETDLGARRNAFLMLYNENEELAFAFLARNMDDVGKYGDGFALLVLDLTRKVCRRDPTQKSRFVRVLFQMLSSTSPSVSYEAAWTLVSLSSAPTAVRAAAMTYVNLLNGQNDNNVKLIVLMRLDSLKSKHSKILQELLMDILRALSSPNPDICKKVLDVVVDVISTRNVQDVVNVLKREVQKTISDDLQQEKGGEYRNMLIRTIHGCAVRFPQVAESVVHVLTDFLGTDSGMQVIIFVRAIVEQYPELRPPLLTKLMESMDSVSSNQVLCVCLWILGEYTESAESITEAFDTIAEQAGEPPYIVQTKEKEAADKAAEADSGPKMVTKNVVLSDGTYATQTVYSETKAPTSTDKTPPLRRMLISGDVFLGETMAACLTKLCLRAGDSPGVDSSKVKSMTATAVLAMCGVVKMAEVTVAAQRSSLADCQERITLCCRALLDPAAQMHLKKIFLKEGRERFAEFLKIIKERELKESATESGDKENEVTTQADDLIHFRQLKAMAASAGDLDLDDGADLARATGYDSAGALSSELSHVYQLSGFADPVYAEALVTVHDYDIVLEILVMNRTPNTLANLTVELSTMGDMKIVERPQSHTIGPLDQMTIRASIKVSSTETGHIFGTIVYDDAATMEKCYVNLNDIHMDIMDYIRPATCTDEAFRSMWAEFEWENKVAISTSITSLLEFLNHIVSSTNMSCLTPFDEKSEKGSFLAANLYARSVFGEDALVNVSVEKKDDNDGKLAGYIRIRSKTQGIALSLGDRITSVQRGFPDQPKA
uniref:Coatomer subunit beta n=1 Tax=Entomoneis paludosa TaxID=265537 RepID=A0A7S2YIL5_9STRA